MKRAWQRRKGGRKGEAGRRCLCRCAVVCARVCGACGGGGREVKCKSEKKVRVERCGVEEREGARA